MPALRFELINYDAAVLDLGLPDGDGSRRSGGRTADRKGAPDPDPDGAGSVEDRVAGLDAGATTI